MTNVAVLLGANRTVAERDMKKVLEFEIELAKVSSTQIDVVLYYSVTVFYKCNCTKPYNHIPNLGL